MQCPRRWSWCITLAGELRRPTNAERSERTGALTAPEGDKCPRPAARGQSREQAGCCQTSVSLSLLRRRPLPVGRRLSLDQASFPKGAPQEQGGAGALAEEGSGPLGKPSRHSGTRVQMKMPQQPETCSRTSSPAVDAAFRILDLDDSDDFNGPFRAASMVEPSTADTGWLLVAGRSRTRADARPSRLKPRSARRSRARPHGRSEPPRMSSGLA
jgi:hypothetical protein